MIKNDCGKSKITIVSYKLAVYSFLVNFIYYNEVFMGSGTAISLSLSFWGEEAFRPCLNLPCTVQYMYKSVKYICQ